MYTIKTILIISIIITGLSCKKDFEKINTNPNSTTETEPEFILSYLLSEAGAENFNWSMNRHLLNWTMQSSRGYGSTETVPYNYLSITAIESVWTFYYTRLVLHAEELLKLTANEEDINKHSVARIWRAYIFHQITDLWGDIPYSEAAIFGQDNKILKPAYDRQEDIYADLLNELEEAVSEFDEDKPVFKKEYDILFNSDLTLWTKFANSLRLRLAIRSGNKEIVEELMGKEDELISSNSESANFQYLTSQADRSPWNDTYETNENTVGQVGGYMVDRMSQLDDPRLQIYAQPTTMFVEDDATLVLTEESFQELSAEGDVYSAILNEAKSLTNKLYTDNTNLLNDIRSIVSQGDTLTENQIDDFTNEIYDKSISYKGFPNLLSNSEVKALTDAGMILSIMHTSFHGLWFMDEPDEINPLLSYAEVCFLKAEAALRGWGASADKAETYYNEGVRANMMTYTNNDVQIISDTEIEEYLSSSAKFNGTLEQIITQKWIALYLDGNEVYAEYRRTGYPELERWDVTIEEGEVSDITIVPVEKSSVPGRIYYPNSEYGLNGENLKAAISELNGNDDFYSQVWWATLDHSVK